MKTGTHWLKIGEHGEPCAEMGFLHLWNSRIEDGPHGLQKRRATTLPVFVKGPSERRGTVLDIAASVLLQLPSRGPMPFDPGHFVTKDPVIITMMDGFKVQGLMLL